MLTITLNSWASLIPSWCLAWVPERNSIPGGKWIKGEINEAVSECRKMEQNVKLVWLSILLQPWRRIIKLHLLSSQSLLISGIISCKTKETSSLLEMLVEDEINPKRTHFLRKLGHQVALDQNCQKCKSLSSHFSLARQKIGPGLKPDPSSIS